MSSFVLKLIAAVTMFIDHAGLLLFPDLEFMRILGRLAFPIFAFFIGEGCRYTSSKLKYFLRVSILGILCQAVYIIEYISSKNRDLHSEKSDGVVEGGTGTIEKEKEEVVQK